MVCDYILYIFVERTFFFVIILPRFEIICKGISSDQLISQTTTPTLSLHNLNNSTFELLFLK